MGSCPEQPGHHRESEKGEAVVELVIGKNRRCLRGGQQRYEKNDGEQKPEQDTEEGLGFHRDYLVGEL